ncbi:MAG: Uma2 family endonuclease [Bacteroidota bacterium]
MESRISEPRPEAATKDVYTYGDYTKWPDEERWELIDGVPYNMSPAPSRIHQKILGELYKQIAVYLTGKVCEVYIAPFDVRLPKGEESDDRIDTVVQPDLVVVCDREKLDERGCKGAPDLVVEVLSPGTAGKDMKIKLALYERVGVKEYWLVDPSNKTVQVYQLETSSRYCRPSIYSDTDRIRVGLFPDLEIDLTSVFSE